MTRRPDAGVTLVEVLVALGLGALIAIAGFGVLQSSLSTQARTEGRLARVSEIQQAMHLISTDLEQISGPLLAVGEGAIGLLRPAFAEPAQMIAVEYALVDDTLRRSVRTLTGVAVQQDLIANVRAVRWQAYTGPGAWQDLAAQDAETLPRAIRAVIDLGQAEGSPSGEIRRIVPLPVLPE